MNLNSAPITTMVDISDDEAEVPTLRDPRFQVNTLEDDGPITQRMSDTEG